MLSRKTSKYFGIEIILILVLFVCIIPYIIAAMYVTPSADDYSFANTARNAMASTYFEFAISEVVDEYLHWQGIWFGVFLVRFISPFNRWGNIGNQIVVAVSLLFFFVVVYCLIRTVYKYIFKCSNSIPASLTTICFLTLAVFMQDTSEAFYWYSVIGGYILPGCVALLGITLGLIGLFKRKSVFCVLAGILLFCGVGGTLMVTAITCVILLGIMLYCWKEKFEVKKITIMFGVALAGGLINALAPGNFERRDTMESGFNIVGTIIKAGIQVVKSIYHLFRDTPICLVIVVLFLLGVYLAKKNTYKYDIPVWVTLYGFLGMVIVDFPVKLAYATYFPARCEFLATFMVVVSLFVIAIYWGGWFERKTNLEYTFKDKLTIGIILVLFVGNIFQGLEVSEFTPINIYKNWANGNLQQYIVEFEELEKELFEAKGEDVVIDNFPDTLGIYCPVGATDNEGMWINKAMASYYGNKTIVYSGYVDE